MKYLLVILFCLAANPTFGRGDDVLYNWRGENKENMRVEPAKDKFYNCFTSSPGAFYFYGVVTSTSDIFVSSGSEYLQYIEIFNPK